MYDIYNFSEVNHCLGRVELDLSLSFTLRSQLYSVHPPEFFCFVFFNFFFEEVNIPFHVFWFYTHNIVHFTIDYTENVGCEI